MKSQSERREAEMSTRGGKAKVFKASKRAKVYK